MHLLIALILQAATPDAAAPVVPPEQVQTDPAQGANVTAAPSTTAAPAPEIQCRWVAPTGQRLRRRVCETVQAIDARAQVSGEATRDMQVVRGGSILEAGMRP
jgi:hypothetical protein